MFMALWAMCRIVQADYEATLAANEAARIEATAARSEATAVATQGRVQAPAWTPPPANPTVLATRPAAVPPSPGGSLRDALAASPWPPELWAKVERVVACESGGRTTAVSPAGYVGLMQVAPWFHGAVPADAVGQLTQGYAVYLKQGWGAWPVCGR